MAEVYNNNIYNNNIYDNDYVDGDDNNHMNNMGNNDIDYDNESENMHYDIALEYDTTYATLKGVIDTMNKYINDAIMIWNTEIVPFMNSNDCYVLDKLNNRDYNKFIEFMKTQKTYKLMTISKQRLEQRLDYLKNNF